MRKYLVSTGVLPRCIGKEFYEYTGIAEAYERLDVDGVELVFLPEWDPRHPPFTPTSADWNRVPKAEVFDIVDLCLKHDLAVPVIHINRDVGNMLCSEDKATVLYGQRILDENLVGASELGSEIAVLHLWDTFSKDLDLERTFDRAYKVSKHHQIRIAVENIPISDKKLTQETAWGLLTQMMPPDYGFTVDLNWSSLYNNFPQLKRYRHRILNVHVQGYIAAAGDNAYTLKPRSGGLDILGCLAELCREGYDGYITLEMNKPKGEEDFKRALQLIKTACRANDYSSKIRNLCRKKEK
ncbi:MAG: sugar phosphate isomerase/epimerase family protein [Limnochordia bacterium]